MNTPLVRTVLHAVKLHPGLMSPILLAYLLRGETIGRMLEKGLMESPLRGAHAGVAEAELAEAIADAERHGWLSKASGFYPALRLTTAGEAQLVAEAAGRCSEASPSYAYRHYHAWRQGAARRRRTPPYRVVSNQVLNAIALRRPRTLDELLDVPGLGKRRALRYVEELLAVGRELPAADQA